MRQATPGEAPTDSSATTAGELMTVTAALRRLIRRRLRAQRAAAGTESDPIRGARLELLHHIETTPGAGVAAAAHALHLAGNSVSTMVNQLVTAGLVHREVDPADRRAARLWLTEAATSRLQAWRTARGQLVGAGLDRLSYADRQAVMAALPALQRLVSNLEETL
jgi:DNA-binding MarR family transcriptional regulator